MMRPSGAGFSFARKCSRSSSRLAGVRLATALPDGPIGTNQAIAHMLADMQTEVEAARTLMWRAAWMVSTGQDALREITMAKLFTSETYVKVASQAMQVLGGFGYSEEFDMARHYRDARAATIAAGTSQIQRNLIANLMGLKVQ